MSPDRSRRTRDPKSRALKTLRGVCRAALALTMLATAFVRADSAGELPPHPRLLFNQEGIATLKQKIQRVPWSQVWSRLRASLDKQLDRPIELPPRGGNWSHNYVCPTHGARLKQGQSLGMWHWEHHCPVGPHVLQGDPSQATLDFDGNAISGVHADYAGQIRDLGLVYQVTGQQRYADRARSILLAYAERYLTYPQHNNRGQIVKKGGGRVASQPLSEATWLVPVVQGADLIWDILSEDERRAVEEKLLRPALDETVLNHSTKPVIHNIQCHRNSAVGLVGLLLGDRQLIEHAIDGPSGYRANMAQGVQADGVWFEGAWGYHFYTIRGLWPLVEAARNCGLDLYGPEFKRLFDAPLRLATPDFRLPAFNDSGEVALGSSASYYELAFARYHDPAYAVLLATGKRDSELALWFGADTLPSGTLPTAGSRNAEASGYAILQRGSGPDATWLCLKYGPHGGGHGHPDKNSFVLCARGQTIMPDSGSHAYGSPLHSGWDKTTLAHSTLVVDEKSQAQATGKCLAFGSVQDVDFAMTDAGPIYPGLRFVRTAALLDANLVVFVDQIEADSQHTFDLACHHNGRWSDLPPGRPFSGPQGAGYDFLREAASRSGSGATGLALVLGDGSRSCLTLAGGEPTELITATRVGADTEHRVPVAIFRRVARRTAFVWAVSLDAAPVQLDVKSPTPAMVTTVQIHSAHGTWRVTADAEHGKVMVAKD